jgi:hypothetical protein
MATIQETVAWVRSKYTYDSSKGPTEDQCAAICNEAAWIHRNDSEKWGVSTKNSGSNGTLSDGSKVAVDIIQNGVTLEIFDCLVSAGWDPNENKYGPANPSWQPKGVLNDPSRPWKAPINPGTQPPPVDPPPVDPPPTDSHATSAQLAKHDKEIKELLVSTRLAAAATLAKFKNLTLVGEAKILGMTVKFTLRPKV